MDTTSLPSLPDISLKKYDKVALAVLVAALVAVAGGALYGLWVVMPLLVELAANTVYFLGMVFVAVLLFMVLAQMWMSRRAFVYKMKMIAKSIRKAVVKSDPIGTIDVAIGNLNERLEDADNRARESAAAMDMVGKRIRLAQESKGNEERLAAKSRTSNEQNLHLVSAERWHKTLEALEPIMANQEARKRKIGEAYQLCKDGIANLENQKATLSVQLEAYQADAAQARSFRAFFGGHNEDMEMIDMAVEEIERQSSACEAEVEQMLRQAEPSLERAKLQQEADADEARARLGLAPVGAHPALPAAPLAPGLPAVKDGVIEGVKR
jgi:hypothetical protein